MLQPAADIECTKLGELQRTKSLLILSSSQACLGLVLGAANPARELPHVALHVLRKLSETSLPGQGQSKKDTFAGIQA